ncbi:MAG TPA: hypothetical protein VGM80_10470 [Gaiellaceae bacterium]|jgi:hypothetical protein
MSHRDPAFARTADEEKPRLATEEQAPQLPILELQTMAGNAAVARAIATGRTQSPAIQRGLLDFMRSDEELYHDAQDDLTDFRREKHATENFRPDTGLGMFDVSYDAGGGSLAITCKVQFDFADGSAAEFPNAPASELAWTEALKNDWKSRYLSTVSSSWSGHHTFYCQKDWWEDLTAAVNVQFVEVEKDPHFNVHVAKIPAGAFRQSSVTAPESHLFGPSAGSGDFDSEDLTPTAKPGGTQIGAVHEAGHMLGLDDEYGTGTPSHSDPVEAEFGHGVTRGADGRIMSGGMDIQPEHGVTFLAGLKDCTDMDEWAHAAKLPRPIPAGAATGAGDLAPGAIPGPGGSQPGSSPSAVA